MPAEKLMTELPVKDSCRVAIIGSGPTGVAAALELKKTGINDIIILDREIQGGGVPRHCGHPPFGLREYHRPMTGPTYARRNMQAIKDAGIPLLLGHSVTRLGAGGLLQVTSTEGMKQIQATRVLLATGTREMPRSARFVSGGRPLGIYNTGALQAMVYLKKMIPFRRPVIVGTEIVSFSALWTCKKAGIQPVAMLEQGVRPQVKQPIPLAVKYFGVPLYLNVQIDTITGRDRVEGVRISADNGKSSEIDCDGVLFTGRFVPESSLARMGGLALDKNSGCPLVNADGRCSDPAYYAAGNLVHHPVTMAGKCYQKGRIIARRIYRDLDHVNGKPA